MPKGKPREWPGRDELLEQLAAHAGNIERTAAAMRLPDGEPVTGQALRSALRRAGILDEAARLRVNAGADALGQVAAPPAGGRTIEFDDPAKLGNVGELMRENGLSTEDWLPGPAVINRWGDPANYMRQVKFQVFPRTGLLLPVRSDGWKAPPRAPRQAPDGRRLTVIIPDEHYPHHDPALAAAFLEWLREFKPDRAIKNGDQLDLATFSKYLANPEHDGEANPTLQACYDGTRAQVKAAGDQCEWDWLDGNHEARLRTAVLQHLRAAYKLKRPDPHPDDGEPDRWPLLAIPFLCRLDELGIRYHEPAGEYHRSLVVISAPTGEHPGVAAMHGWRVAKGAGVSALKTLDDVAYHVAVGHTHRQGLTSVTKRSLGPYGTVTLTAAEMGTMALTRDGLGHAPGGPDWQPGWGTVTTWEDGTHRFDLAEYRNGRVTWQGWDWKT